MAGPVVQEVWPYMYVTEEVKVALCGVCLEGGAPGSRKRSHARQRKVVVAAPAVRQLPLFPSCVAGSAAPCRLLPVEDSDTGKRKERNEGRNGHSSAYRRAVCSYVLGPAAAAPWRRNGSACARCSQRGMEFGVAYARR